MVVDHRHNSCTPSSREINKDAPRFAWSGVMLDVSRTFMPVTLVRSENNIDKQLSPLILALSEAAWSSTENRNWDQFRQAAARNSEYLKLKHVNVYNDESLKH